MTVTLDDVARRRRRAHPPPAASTSTSAVSTTGAVGVTFDEDVPPLDVVRRAAGRLRRPALPRQPDEAPDGLPVASRRDGELLLHAVFHRYHTEHEMLRYLRRLIDRDLSLDPR